jgi:hypothetical protein
MLLSFVANGQEKDSLKVKFSGFIEAYYSYDFNKPIANEKLSFLYNYNRHNEFNINNSVLKTQFEYANTYASIAFHSGTYVTDNYASENIKFLSEAYVGLYLNSSKKTSVEFGILPSYIGFESATSSSNLTLTRSILAENSPYFMTGVKLSHNFSSEWNLSILATNGWQRINKLDKNVTPAFGTQLVYNANEKSMLNWSTFIGKELYLNHLGMRYFSNLYWNFGWNSKFKTILGFDLGVQKNKPLNQYYLWMSPIIIAQYAITNNWQTALRVEYFQDKKNVVTTSLYESFNTMGTSLNLDYVINPICKFRIEARLLKAEKPIFYENEKHTVFLTSSLCFQLN